MAAGGQGDGDLNTGLEEDFGRVNVVSVTGRGPLGLMVSSARQVGEQELGLKVDDLAEGVERPELDQDILPGDILLAINDVPLLSFPTETCVRLLELSSRCERRKLRIFRRGEVREEEREHPGFRILQALGYPPDMRLVSVSEGRLGLVVSPARQTGRRPEQVIADIPEGWLRIERKVRPDLPEELEVGDVIIRVNAIPLDDFDFPTALRILQLAARRVLTLVKHQPEAQAAAAAPPPPTEAGAVPSFAYSYPFYARGPAFEARRTPYVPTFGSFASGVGRAYGPPVDRVRGWHLVGRRLMDRIAFSTPFYRTFAEPVGGVGEAAA